MGAQVSEHSLAQFVYLLAELLLFLAGARFPVALVPLGFEVGQALQELQQPLLGRGRLHMPQHRRQLLYLRQACIGRFPAAIP